MKKYFCMVVCTCSLFVQAMDQQSPKSPDKFSSFPRDSRPSTVFPNTPMPTRRKVIPNSDLVHEPISPRSMNTKYDVHPNPLNITERQNSLDKLMKQKSDSQCKK
jgi:hypothetical protein